MFNFVFIWCLAYLDKIFNLSLNSHLKISWNDIVRNVLKQYSSNTLLWNQIHKASNDICTRHKVWSVCLERFLVSYSNYLFCTKIIKTIYSNLWAGAAQTLAGLPNRGLQLIIKNAGAVIIPALVLQCLQSSELQEISRRCSRQERGDIYETGGGRRQRNIINEWKS